MDNLDKALKLLNLDWDILEPTAYKADIIVSNAYKITKALNDLITDLYKDLSEESNRIKNYIRTGGIRPYYKYQDDIRETIPRIKQLRLDIFKEIENIKKYIPWAYDNSFKEALEEASIILNIKLRENLSEEKYNDVNYWFNPDDGTWNPTILIDGKKARLRAGIIIVKDGSEILLGEEEQEPGVFSLPGGAIDKGETEVDTAVREAQEEVHIKVKNAKYTEIDYCVEHDDAMPWVKEHIPEKEWWYHYYTKLVIADYDDKYEGKIADEHEDPILLNTSKFYKFEDVINEPSFKPEWKKALIKFGYLKDNIKEFLNDTNNINESKQDEQKLIDFAGNSLAKRFLAIKHRLKSPENDIYFWLKKDVVELEDKVNEIESTVSKTKQKEIEKTEGAELVAEGNGYKAYRIDTYEASCLYGKGTKWCTASTKTRKHFNDYKKNGVKLYYFIKDNEKYALALYPKIIGDVEEYGIKSNYELYDAKDKLITDLNQIKSLNLPEIPGIKLIFEILPTKIENGVLVNVYPYNQGEFVIPNSVNEIGDYAFEDCTSLTSITIPNSVTSIGDYAFSNCTSLTSITIPSSVTSIGGAAFYNCLSLTSIIIPDSVTSIGEFAFFDCTSLTSIKIPSSVTSIGRHAFYCCTSLTSITIPNSVTSISKGVFSQCTSLTIYAEATSKPTGWDADWNPDNRPVKWGYKVNKIKESYNESFKESLDIKSKTLLDAIEEVFECSYEPVHGATYLLPNGKFVNLDKYFKLHQEYDYEFEFAYHGMIQEILSPYFNILNEEEEPLVNEGCIRLNDAYEDAYCYIQLSEKISPTNTQYTSLAEWVNNLNNNIHLEIGTTQIVKGYDVGYKENQVTTEEIIKEIKQYYVTGRLGRLEEKLSKEQLPKYLYHATYGPYFEQIKRDGAIKIKPPHKNWIFNNEYDTIDAIYLAGDSDVAISYAETSEAAEEELLDNIILLTIDTSKLDLTQLNIDHNVKLSPNNKYNKEALTYEYYKDIPLTAIMERESFRYR